MVNYNQNKMLAKSVTALVKDNPLIINPKRPVYERNARAGVTQVDTIDLGPIEVRLIPFIRRYTNEFRELPTDQTTFARYIMILPMNHPLQLKDYFNYENEELEISHVAGLTFHRVHALVTDRDQEARR